MAVIERRTLKKAPTRDVVDAFTAPVPEPLLLTPVAGETSAQKPTTTAPASPNDVDQRPVSHGEVPRDGQPVRRGPGRPRSKRRMEPFSSKLEIELRDAIDAYLFKHGGTLVDLLDEALRARIQE